MTSPQRKCAGFSSSRRFASSSPSRPWSTAATPSMTRSRSFAGVRPDCRRRSSASSARKPWLLDRLGVRGAAVLAAAAGIVRWSAMGFTNSILVLAILQPLHGLTFALLHLACMRVIGNVVPPGVAATAQALYAFGAGLVTAALT